MTKTCPLCRTADAKNFLRDARRDYRRCRNCGLIFVPSEQHITAIQEKAEYDLHQNNPNDPGYRQFLRRLLEPMNKLLLPGSEGLDFGSGPGPTLSLMFEELGHTMAIYDRFYADNPDLLDRRYDFITATEVLEHLRNPREELDRLWALLKPGGSLGIMTKLARIGQEVRQQVEQEAELEVEQEAEQEAELEVEQEAEQEAKLEVEQEAEQEARQAFARWHYKNDLTHVCFFSRLTFEWLGKHQKTRPMFIGQDVIIMTKSAFHSDNNPKIAQNST